MQENMKENIYSKMQQTFYNNKASLWSVNYRTPVVGSWEKQNSWAGYDKLWTNFDTEGKIALDWATGPGRNIARYWNRFARIDGVDFVGVIAAAKRHFEGIGLSNQPQLFITNGYNLQEPDVVPSDAYDFVFSTIAFQHIAVHEIRYNYLKEFFRVLKSGGWVTKQMGFGTWPADSTDSRSQYKTVGYFDNEYDSPNTNGLCDTRCESPDQIKEDLEAIGFRDFQYEITEPGWLGNDGPHPKWIFFRAQKP